MSQTKKIITSLTWDVQFYFSKHQALVAAQLEQKLATGKAWSKALRAVTLIQNQLNEIQEGFTKQDWSDFKRLQAAMTEDEDEEHLANERRTNGGGDDSDGYLIDLTKDDTPPADEEPDDEEFQRIVNPDGITMEDEQDEVAPVIKIQRFAPANAAALEQALQVASPEERERHEDAKAYNERDYERKMEMTFRHSSDLVVISGKIYYLTDMKGDEKGLTLLNRLETLGACLHDAPFYRVILTGSYGDELQIGTTRLGGDLQPYKYSRDMNARRAYAKSGWIMTTEVEVVNAWIDLQTNRDEAEQMSSRHYAEVFGTDEEKKIAATDSFSSGTAYMGKRSSESGKILELENTLRRIRARLSIYSPGELPEILADISNALGEEEGGEG